MIDQNFMEIILLVILINLGLILWRRIKIGFMLDPVYNGILAADFALVMYGFTDKHSLHSLYAWLGIGIFFAGVVIPVIIGRFVHKAIRAGNWQKAEFWLNIRRHFQPSVEITLQLHQLKSISKAHSGDITSIEKDLLGEIKKAEHADDPFQLFMLRKTLAELYVFSGNWDKGISVYNNYLNPEGNVHPDLMAAIVRAGFESGNYSLMWNAYKNMLDSDLLPSETADYLLPSQVMILAAYGKTGQLKKFLKFLKKNKTPLPKESAKYWLGISRLIEGKPEKARNFLSFNSKEAQKYPILAKLASQKLENPPKKPPKPNEEQRELLETIIDTAKNSAVIPKRNKTSYATYFFLAACVFAYTLEIQSGGTEDPFVLYKFGANFRHLFITGEWWRGFTAIFLHANFLHIFFNMYILWIFGKFIEDHYGSLKTFAIIVISGFAGNLASALTYGNGISLGASSSVFGILGAALIMLLTNKNKWDEEWRKKQLYNLIFLIILNLFIGFSMAMIDNAAHLGGFAAGIILAFIFNPYNIFIKSLTFILFFLSVAATSFGAYKAVDTSLDPPFKNIHFNEINMTFSVPVYWQYMHDSVRGEFLQSPSCSMAPTMKVTVGPESSLGFDYRKNKIISLPGDKKIKFLSENVLNGWKELIYSYQLKKQNGNLIVFMKKIPNDPNKNYVIILFAYDNKCSKTVKKFMKKIIYKKNKIIR